MGNFQIYGSTSGDAAYVIPPEASDSSSESDPEVNVPLNKLAQTYRHEREDSDSEDDIPLMELAKRIKAKDQLEIESQNTCEENMDSMSDQSSRDMRVDEVTRVKQTEQNRSKKNVKASEKDFLDVKIIA